MDNLNMLSERQREIWVAVEDFKKKNPETSNMAALKALRLNPSTFAAAKKIVTTGKGYGKRLKAYKKGVELGKRKYTRKPKMLTLPVDETPTITSVVAFVGNPTEVVRATREFLKGH